MFHNSLVPQATYLALETAALIGALLLAYLNPDIGARWFSRVESFGLNIARKRRLSILICAALPIILRLAMLPWLGVPEPAIQEESSYLLSADTFASGRLTNPPHPMAVHLETFQVIESPTYSSIRPPAQGLFMAAGEIATHNAWAGVCLSIAVLCGSLCWMLQAWLPPGWALFGGLLAAVRIGVFSWWMNSYWGGAVAAIGGILVLGALPRIKRRLRPGDALWMALGICLLFTTRAYEGLFVLLPVAADLAWWLLRKDSFGLPQKIFRLIAPTLAVLCLFFAWEAYYNWRVTGVATHAPYTLGRKMYSVAQPFLWQPPHPAPAYHHDVMRRFYVGWEMDTYRHNHSLRGYPDMEFWRTYDFWRFYVRPVLTLPLLFLPWAWRDRRIRLCLVIMAIAILGQSVETWFSSYYGAPLTAAVFLIILQCMRHMRVSKWRGRPTGLFLTRAVSVICAGMFLSVMLTHLMGFTIGGNATPWASSKSALHQRALVLRQLEHIPGKQLAIVHYSPEHNVHEEWVFNDANIDQSKVVWAHDMGARQNQELVDYFKGRTIWLIEPDRNPIAIEPYPAGSVQASADQRRAPE